ncbi:hypothetical protein ABKV19_015813 [Rosa sericea]
MESPPEVAADSFSAGTRERVKDANLEQQFRQVADEHGILPHHLKRLFLYFSLFPFGYEFRKDELVQLWIAEGFIRERQRERMEDTASEHFNSLEKEGFFVFSRCDFTMDFDSVLSDPTDNPSNFLYKVNPSKHSLLEDTISSGNYFKAVDGKLDGASEMTRHLSLIGEDIDGMAFGILQNFKHLRTLHMLSCHGSSMKHVPRDLCFTLTFLKTLNLSGTLISELPSSIGNVKSLRYIDASHTPIARLPESIDSLHNLQTIKLRGCIHFVQLPKGMKKLSNLRHIDLDIIRQLDSMPAHLGNLSNLQTLPAFLVGRDDGCRVGELKYLNDLKGSFNISRLENVLSKEEAEKAALIEKKCIHRLELRWSDMFVEYAQQEKILECLQPHSGLKELQIQQYSGSILPTWISNPSFTDLVVITLYRCRNCKLLPCMGQLPALKSLSIIEVNEVKEINHQFFRKGLVDHAFPKLERLEVDSMLSLKQWKDIQLGDLPSLVKLTLDSCPELVTLPALLCLKSLKHLELRCCPKLMALPTGGLPTSLEFFLLLDCLELKEWCLKIEHWSMLYHVPSIWFDHEEIKPHCFGALHLQHVLMTSSVHDHSDGSESDDQQKHSESPMISSSPAPGMSHPGIPGPMQYVAPPQIGAGHAVVHLPIMGIQQAGVPLPKDAVEEQYDGILRRRLSRAKAESENKALKLKKPYLHESRHQLALRRARECGGRFLNAKKDENEESEGDNSQAIIKKMMLGEPHRPNPTIHVPPWLTPYTLSGVSVNSDVTNANNEALATLQRYLPSNEASDPDPDSDSEISGLYSCDYFRMFEFKVRRCARGRSHDWTDCPFAHPGEQARRRDPRKFHYSGSACPDFRKGHCKKGDSCEFAHGVFECWLHPARYRTKPCKDGTSCKRRVCFFAHTPEQLRVLPQQSPRGSNSVNSAESYDGSPLRQAMAMEGCEEEPPMEGCESGRDLRAKMFERLREENCLERVDPTQAQASGAPDVGWVS